MKIDSENQLLVPKGKQGGINETQDPDNTIPVEDEELEQTVRRRKIKYMIIGGVALVLVILAIVLPLTLIKKNPEPDPTPPGPTPPPKPDPPKPQPPGPLPFGYNNSFMNPYFIDVSTEKNTVYNRKGQLYFKESKKAVMMGEESDTLLLGQGTGKKIGFNWTQSLGIGPNNPIIKRLNYEFDMVSQKVARFQLTDTYSDRFSIPEDVVAKPPSDKSMRPEMVGLDFKSSQSSAEDPFSFSFQDNVNPLSRYISTKGQSLIFTDKYIQMDFLLYSDELHGFGERLTTHRLKEGSWGMWSTSHTDPLNQDAGLGRGGQHGVHPFLLVKSRNQQYTGVYFRNANAQLPIIRFTETNPKDTILSYITLGGQIEVYFFISGTASQVIQDYHRVFGKAQLPPFWALGWQEASQTVYNTTQERDNQLNLIRTVEHYKNLNLPLETVYLDQKQSNKNRNFALDQELISNITDLRIILDMYKTKLIAYVDATVIAPQSTDPVHTLNPTYVNGSKVDAFIKTTHRPNTQYNNNLVGLRGLNKCVYIDWFNQEKSTVFWFQELEKYLEEVNFDGLWTTMNEPYSETQGELAIEAPAQSTTARRRRVLSTNVQADPSFDTTWYNASNFNGSSTYYMPVIPQLKERGPYDVFSPSLNASHNAFRYWNTFENKWSVRNESEYNLHSLYGHGMMQTTAKAVSALSASNLTRLFDKRPFILTRSTFTGTNQYASYAIRYKYRTWQSLQNAIPHMMNMNMFGFTHSGVDACGALDLNATVNMTMDEELCLRWIQLSTFFPLARHSQDFTHNDTYVSGPLGFKDPAKIADLNMTMRDRMQYLRFMYTCLFESSEFGGSCFDPLYFHYTQDTKSTEQVTGTNDTFLFGGAVKVSPVVTPPSGTTFKSHFPKGRWLNLATLETKVVDQDGQIDLNIQSTVNAHLRPGAIIPHQDLMTVKTTVVRTTEDLLALPIGLVINRNENKAASGTLFLDDGISKSELQQQTYEYYTIQHTGKKSLQFELTKGKRGAQSQRHSLDKIVIGDAEDLQDTNFACAHSIYGGVVAFEASYDNATKALTLRRPDNFDDEKQKFNSISNIFYGNSAKDVNLCVVQTYEYMLDAATNMSVLQYNNATFTLKHKMAVLPDIAINLMVYDEGIIKVRWTWSDNTPDAKKRFVPEVPDELFDTNQQPVSGSAIGKHVIITKNPFTIQFVQQQGMTQPLFELDRFIYDAYLSWVGMKAYTLPGLDYRGIMGLGERGSSGTSLFYKDGIYSMWAQGARNQADDGDLPGGNGQGVHPFFMYQHSANKWVGVFSRHMQAQDWVIKNYPDKGQTVIEQISTGGVNELFVMINSNSPDSVVSYYQRIIGKPALMPQWAYGWHQSKQCLRTVQDLREVIQGYRNNSIPIDTQWIDSDYMHNYQNFKVDSLYFGDLQTYVQESKNSASPVKFVPIVTPGIASRTSYSTYRNGSDQGVFLKGADNQIFIGMQQASQVAYPDWFNPSTYNWWASELTQFQKKEMAFDGLWLDQNEPTNMCNGACFESQGSSIVDNLYYTPSGRNLEYMSLPVDLVHKDARSASGITHLDAHNIYGTQMSLASYEWFINQRTQRPFVISRSTFAGAGKYAGKTLSGGRSTYEDMQQSVTGAMMMNVFGVPFAGGDICGYTGADVNPELCVRWHQVGAFQPLSRNHRDCNGKAQEPFRFIDNKLPTLNTTYTALMKKAILEKYSLLRYYYTQMYLLSLDQASTFYKPVFFEFPSEKAAFTANPTENVMLGPSLKLSIKTSANKDVESDVNAYVFPKGIWCDIFHPETECVTVLDIAEMQVLPAGLKDYQVFMREGHIIPFQNASRLNISSSEDLQRHPVDLHINPQNVTGSKTTVQWKAAGQYVNDDGLAPIAPDQQYNHYQISFSYMDKIAGDVDDEVISLKISLKNEGGARSYYNNETKCTTVNQNDILGGIYIFDEFEFFQHKTYIVRLIRPDQTYEDLGLAKYNLHTNRVEYEGPRRPQEIEPVCLSYIEEIKFVPTVTAPAA